MRQDVRRQKEEVNRVKKKGLLTTSSLVWITVGNMVGSGIMVLTGAAAEETGYAVWLAFVVATAECFP